MLAYTIDMAPAPVHARATDKRGNPLASSSEVYVTCKTAAEVARAIRTMVIRGAPAIGVAAAMGIALGMRKSKATGTQKFAAEFHKICELMAATRPHHAAVKIPRGRTRRTSLASAAALVPQIPFVFDDTVRNNATGVVENGYEKTFFLYRCRTLPRG